MSDLLQRLLASSLCAQLTLLGTGFEWCVARRVAPAAGPSPFSSPVGPRETRAAVREALPDHSIRALF